MLGLQWVGRQKEGVLHFSIFFIFLYILKFLTMDICLYHVNSESVDDGVGYLKNKFHWLKKTKGKKN